MDSGIKQNFFRLHGRLNRLRYVARCFSLLIIILFYGLLINPVMNWHPGALFMPIKWIVVFMPIICLISWILLTCRRLEDLGLSPKFAIIIYGSMLAYIIILPEVAGKNAGLFFLSLIFGIPLNFKRGTIGKNKYGEDPLKENKEKNETC